MGFQSAEVADRIIGEYNLTLQTDEYIALTRIKAHTDLFRESQVLPGNLIEPIRTNRFFFFLVSFS